VVLAGADGKLLDFHAGFLGIGLAHGLELFRVFPFGIVDINIIVCTGRRLGARGRCIRVFIAVIAARQTGSRHRGG